jgi:DNA-binding HxlR family transcriptional regulator
MLVNVKSNAMARRSYSQYCGLARALDVVGERWALLIVRELLLAPARYGELERALPGIASNLLAMRLRELQAAGVLERRLSEDRPGVLYALTPWGQQLREPLAGLIRWSAPLMLDGPRGESFRPHWLVVALGALLEGASAPEQRCVAVEVDGTLIGIAVDRAGASVGLGAAPGTEATLSADAATVLALAAGALSADQAVAAGSCSGRSQALAEVFAT